MNRGLVARLAQYDRLVEVGIGNRPAAADALARRSCDVTATDIRDRSVPDGVAFVRDDVTDPDPTVYRDADAVYALRCPPELQRHAHAVARQAGADFLFTTLGADPAVVPATPTALETVTLFRATDEAGARSGLPAETVARTTAETTAGTTTGATDSPSAVERGGESP